jgi:hypothetical protein
MGDAIQPGAGFLCLLAVGILLQEELVAFASGGLFAEVVLFNLSLREQGCYAEAAAGILRSQKLILADRCLQALGVMQRPALFSEKFGDGEDAGCGVNVAWARVVKIPEAIHGGSVVGLGAGLLRDGFKVFAAAFSLFPRRRSREVNGSGARIGVTR